MIWQFVRLEDPKWAKDVEHSIKMRTGKDKPWTQKSKSTTQKIWNKEGRDWPTCSVSVAPPVLYLFLGLLLTHVFRVDKYNRVKSLRGIFCCLPGFLWMVGRLGFIITGGYQEVPGYCEKFRKVLKIGEIIFPPVGSISAHLQKARITDEAKIKKWLLQSWWRCWNGDVQITAGSCEPQLGIALEMPVT